MKYNSWHKTNEQHVRWENMATLHFFHLMFFSARKKNLNEKKLLKFCHVFLDYFVVDFIHLVNLYVSL